MEKNIIFTEKEKPQNEIILEKDEEKKIELDNEEDKSIFSSIFFKKYKPTKKITQGSYSLIYSGINTETKEKVAIKLESRNNSEEMDENLIKNKDNGEFGFNIYQLSIYKVRDCWAFQHADFLFGICRLHLHRLPLPVSQLFWLHSWCVECLLLERPFRL